MVTPMKKILAGSLCKISGFILFGFQILVQNCSENEAPSNNH